MGVRGAAVRDDGGPPSVPGRGRGGPLQQHRQHGGQVGRSSGGGRRLRSAVRTVQVSPDMEQGGQGYLQRGMSYYLYLVRPREIELLLEKSYIIMTVYLL